MELEVEQKFRVERLSDVAAALTGLNAPIGEPRLEVDRYFAHPSRDFAATDEALRIRSRGSEAFVTYKGPKLDADTKTRREIEVALASGEAERMSDAFECLGFRAVFEVRKQRRAANLSRGGFAIEVVLDEVTGLGTFVELEIKADSTRLVEAKTAVQSLAHELGLTANERRSYLEMLLALRSSDHEGAATNA